MKNGQVFNWLEIPVLNFEQAKRFYENVFDIQLECVENDGYRIGFFPMNEQGIGASIICGDGYVPSGNGPLVYLNASPNIDLVIEKIEKNGGKLLSEKNYLGEGWGFNCYFVDTEGNRLGLQSEN